MRFCFEIKSWYLFINIYVFISLINLKFLGDWWSCIGVVGLLGLFKGNL